MIDASSDNLQEHFLSEIHQKCLGEAVNSYVQQIHMTPKQDLIPSDNEENFSDIFESVDMLAEGVSCLHDDNIQMHQNNIQIQNALLEQQNNWHNCKVQSKKVFKSLVQFK